MYRKDYLERTGLFDEAHFAYLEDVDLGYRARIAGFYNVMEPAAVVYHAGSGFSGSRYNAFKISHSSRNNVYLIYKNMPLFQLVLNAPFLLAGFGIKILFFARKGFGGIYPFRPSVPPRIGRTSGVTSLMRMASSAFSITSG